MHITKSNSLDPFLCCLFWAGSREVDDASHRLGARALSADRDLLHGSSLELSPSDSSGGTYMWDEEVLEPIGRTTQLCRSYESNLNSMVSCAS